MRSFGNHMTSNTTNIHVHTTFCSISSESSHFAKEKYLCLGKPERKHSPFKMHKNVFFFQKKNMCAYPT